MEHCNVIATAAALTTAVSSLVGAGIAAYQNRKANERIAKLERQVRNLKKKIK